MVHNVDIFPTVLDLMGVKDTVPVNGSDLVPLIEGNGKGPPQETYVETYLSANSMFADKHGDQRVGFRRFGIRTPDWKFVVNDPIPILDRDDPPPVTPEVHAKYFSEDLYDLHTDPGETKNVIDAHPDLAAEFRKRVAYYQSLKAEGQGSEKVQLDDASRERLRNLGYLAH